MDQFGDGDLAARQEVGQQSAHGLARVIGIKVFRLEARNGVRRIFLRRRNLHLVVVILENLEGEEIAGVVVVSFLDDLNAGGLIGRHQFLRNVDRAMAVIVHVMHRPAALGSDGFEDLVVNVPSHPGPRDAKAPQWNDVAAVRFKRRLTVTSKAGNC